MAAEEAAPLNKLELPSRSEEELREFVLAFCDNRIFTSAHLTETQKPQLGLVFMPIGLGAFEGHDEESLMQVGIIYEYLSEALPRSLNGMPMFPSLKMLNAEDWNRCRKAILREMERRQEIIL